MRRWFNRSLLSSVLYYTGILHLIALSSRFRNSSRPVILMGHRVIDNSNIKELDDVDRMALDSGHAITPVDLDKRLRFASFVRKPGDPSALTGKNWNRSQYYLTFDDGYLDNVISAGPVLQRLGIKAVIFLLPDLVRNPDWSPWWDHYSRQLIGPNKLASYAEKCSRKKMETRGFSRDSEPGYKRMRDNGKYRYIGSKELDELQDSPTFYVANHTVSHPNLTLLSDSEIDDELNNGSEFLSSHNRYLSLFAYPFGFYNQRVLDRVSANVHITTAFATGRGSYHDHHAFRRINLNNKSFPLFMAEFLGVFDFSSCARRNTHEQN